MADLEITSTSLTITGTGFSSEKRYLRKATGGAVATCSGRTWAIGSGGAYITSGPGDDDTGGPWVAFKYSNDTQTFNFSRVIVSGYDDNRAGTVTDPDPSLTECDIE